MAEYNELTKRLLTVGYDAGNFPENVVHIAYPPRTPQDPLDNYYGGFEYNWKYRDSIVYQTGCGKYVLGRNVISDMSYMGVTWCHENDNPVIRCPYDNPKCPANDPLLYGTKGGGLCIQCFCACHPTDAAYDYENSIEKVDQERHEEKERKYQKYADAHGGRVCRNHMYYDERTREWNLRYNPGDCARLKCSGMCPILGRELDKKKGNVYYDIKIKSRRYDLDGTLFEGQIDTTITRGIRKFKSPVSMDICRNYVKLCQEDLIRDVMLNDYHSELFFAKYYGREFSVDVLNIRAEQRESRDLAQDLEDIRNGIKVHHASDDEKKQKAEKSQRRKKAKEAKIARLEKKLLSTGYYNLETHSLDRTHADKWLGQQRIDELETMRLQKLSTQQNIAQQLSITDFMEMETGT